MTQLFGVQRPAITKHLKNIFESNALQEDVVSSILEHPTAHGAIGGWTQVQRQQVDAKALTEYEKFNKQQRIESDFDRTVKKLLQNKGAK